MSRALCTAFVSILIFSLTLPCPHKSFIRLVRAGQTSTCCITTCKKNAELDRKRWQVSKASPQTRVCGCKHDNIIGGRRNECVYGGVGVFFTFYLQQLHKCMCQDTWPLSCDDLFVSLMVQQTTVFDDKMIFIDSFIDPLFVQTSFHLCTPWFFSPFKFMFYSPSPCLSCSLKILKKKERF